jgi:hypothetical protein
MNGMNTTTRWRVMILLLLLLSLACLAAIAIDGKRPLGVFPAQVLQWKRETSSPLGHLALPPRWLSIVGVLLTSSLCGILLMYTFPTPIKYMGEAFSQPLGNLARLALAGLVGAVLVAGLSLSATFAIGTFPLAVFLSSALFLASFAGIVALAYAIGNNLLRRAGWGHLSPVVMLMLGVFLLFTLTELPLVGIIFRLVFVFLGAGAIITTRFGTGQPWTLETFREE